MNTHDQHHFPKSLDTCALPVVVDQVTRQAELDTLRVREKAHTCNVSYTTFCEGPYEESSRYRDFMGWTVPWYSVPQDSVTLA